MTETRFKPFKNPTRLMEIIVTKFGKDPHVGEHFKKILATNSDAPEASYNAHVKLYRDGVLELLQDDGTIKLGTGVGSMIYLLTVTMALCHAIYAWDYSDPEAFERFLEMLEAKAGDSSIPMGDGPNAA